MLGAERLGYFKASSCLFLKSVSFATKPLWVFSAAVVRTLADTKTVHPNLLVEAT